MLYDSERNGKDSSIFRKKTAKYGQLYFIAVDSNDNVFGHYLVLLEMVIIMIPKYSYSH